LNEGLFPANRLAQINGDDPPPSLQPHYRAFVATTRQSAPLRRIGTFGLAVGAACAFPLPSPARFSRSVPKPGRLHAGCRSVGIRTSSELIPKGVPAPGFDIVYENFDASAAVRLRSPLSTLPAGIIVPAFPRRSPPRLLAEAARGSLGSATRLPNPKGPPSSPVQLRSAVWTGFARDARHSFPVRRRRSLAWHWRHCWRRGSTGGARS